MEKTIKQIQKDVASLLEQFIQHRHTGLDSLQVFQDDLAGFVSQVDVFANATQVIATGVESIVHFNTEVYDPGREFDPVTFTFTAKTPGMYQFSTAIRYDDSAGILGTMGIRVKKNGTTYFESLLPSTDQEITLGISQMIKLQGGDTIAVYAIQTSGASKTLLAGRSNNFLSIKRISE